MPLNTRTVGQPVASFGPVSTCPCSVRGGTLSPGGVSGAKAAVFFLALSEGFATFLRTSRRLPGDQEFGGLLLSVGEALGVAGCRAPRALLFRWGNAMDEQDGEDIPELDEIAERQEADEYVAEVGQEVKDLFQEIQRSCKEAIADLDAATRRLQHAALAVESGEAGCLTFLFATDPARLHKLTTWTADFGGGVLAVVGFLDHGGTRQIHVEPYEVEDLEGWNIWYGSRLEEPYAEAVQKYLNAMIRRSPSPN